MKKIISIILLCCLVSLIAIPIIIAKPNNITQEEHFAAESKQSYEYEHGLPFTPNAANSQYIPTSDTSKKNVANAKTIEEMNAEKEAAKEKAKNNPSTSVTTNKDEFKELDEKMAKATKEEAKITEKEKDTYKILEKYYNEKIDLSSIPTIEFRDEVISLMVDAITTQNLTKAEHKKVYDFLYRRQTLYEKDNPMYSKIRNALENK